MPNALYNALGGQQPNLMQMLQQFRSNPMQMLAQRGMQVPQNIAGDPQAVLQHLLRTGQVNQGQVNRAYQMAQQFKPK